MMRALIVDDEIYSREEMAALLEETGEFTIAGKCANAFEAIQAIKKERTMKEYTEIIEELSEEIIEATEHRDDLDMNVATFCESINLQIRDKVSELASDRFCPMCSAKMKTVMDDRDGTNLEEVSACSNPDCH